MLHKTNYESYYKDISTGAVINKKEEDLLEYRNKINSIKNISSMKEEIDVLKNELIEIKNILFKILEK